MASLLTSASLLFRGIAVQQSRNLCHVSCRSSKYCVVRFKPTPEEDIQVRVTRFCKPNYNILMYRSRSFINDSVTVPVKFHQESTTKPQPACPDISEPKVHSLLQNKSSDPGRVVSPWSPFLGCFRWYAKSNLSGRDTSKCLDTRIVGRFGIFFDASHHHEASKARLNKLMAWATLK